MMKKMKLALVILFILALVLVILQNTIPVKASFLWFTGEIPLVVLLFLTTVGGFISGLLVSFLKKG